MGLEVQLVTLMKSVLGKRVVFAESGGASTSRYFKRGAPKNTINKRWVLRPLIVYWPHKVEIRHILF